MNKKKIFVSYRRSDSAGHAGRLYDYLKDYFGEGAVFFDFDTIKAGVDFEQKIKNELDDSDAVLVLIGNQWLESKDANGSKRLENPDDYVRLEIETALDKGIVVIPVLLEGAQMPSGNSLPARLYDLSLRNAIKINDAHWSSDFKLLAANIKIALGMSRSRKEDILLQIRQWIFAFSILGSFLAFIRPFLLDPVVLGLFLRILYGMVLAANLMMVSYLVGKTRRDLNQRGARTSLIIMVLAFYALLISTAQISLFDEAFLSYITQLILLIIAWLFSFVEVNG